MRSLTFAVFLAAASSSIAAGAEGAHADEPEKRAQQLYDEGEAAYKAGKLEEALTAFSAAYDTAAVSGLLFNIGQCHRQLKHHEKAAEYFQRYLDDETDIPNKQAIVDLVTEERALAEKEKAAAGVAGRSSSATEGANDIWRSPVFWGIAGGAAVAVLVGGTIAVAVATQPPPAQPQGSLGTFDLRPAP